MFTSVIIPTFNRCHTLARAIDSVLAQTVLKGGSRIEIIVVDDGSTDATKQLLATKYPNVVYQHQHNRGVSAARNVGLATATGEWLALLDSDDQWHPNKLEAQFALLKETELKVCHTDEVWWRNGQRVNQMNKHKKQGGWIFQRCLPLCAMSPSSILMHHAIVDEVGKFDESLPACEDYDYWLRLTHKFEVAYVALPCINKFGGHADQLSRQFWGMDRFRVQALEKVLHCDLSPLDRAAAEAMLFKKLNVLLLGARKHDNRALVKTCEEKLSAMLVNQAQEVS